MFESRARLAEQIAEMLAACRSRAGARYAAVVTAEEILLESSEGDEDDVLFLRQRLRDRGAELVRLPEQMAQAGPERDPFDGFDDDSFLVAVLNGRVALVFACPDAEQARAHLDRPLATLADRLFRYEPRWRTDAQGRGLFVGRPRLDVVVVGRGVTG